MGDAPAADATNDAQEDNKNKLKKKKNEPEKKEKLVIHGRKDEDILGSAYVKKYRRDDPTDWSRYADNPRGMLNRRRLTREERRRQFTVQNVVGDPRETAPRNFDALFEESDNRLTKPKTHVEAFRLRVLRLCGGRWWDRMYLFNLGWVLVLLPAAMEDDFGLGCAAGPHHRRGEDGRIWQFTKVSETGTKSEYEYTASPGSGDPKECQVLWPPLLFMVACTIPPIIGAVFLRFTSFGYLKSMRDERRYWSAFFVLCLKTLAQRPSVPKEFHEAAVKLWVSLKAGIRALAERMQKGAPAKVAPSEAPIDCEEAPAPGAAPQVVENEDPLLAAARQRQSIEDLEEEAVRRAEEMRASLQSMEGEKVEWRCVVCGGVEIKNFTAMLSL